MCILKGNVLVDLLIDNLMWGLQIEMKLYMYVTSLLESAIYVYFSNVVNLNFAHALVLLLILIN